MVEEPIEGADGPEFRRRHGIDIRRKPVIAVLPGSRASELRRHEPVFGETVRQLARRIEGLRVLVPTLPQNRAVVTAKTTSWAAPVTVVEGKAEKYAAFAASDAALAASGMATLELALAAVPMIVCYRANPLTAAIARRILLVDHIAMPNIIADRRAAPEFVQRQCSPRRLVPAVEELLHDAGRRHDQIESFREIADPARARRTATERARRRGGPEPDRSRRGAPAEPHRNLTPVNGTFSRPHPHRRHQFQSADPSQQDRR